MRFREGASGIYHVRTLANGKPTDDQGRFETIVTISIPRPDGTLRFTATGEERWRVPANVPEIWPRHDDPCEPIFRGPNAREKRKKWRSKRFHRDVEKERRQRQAREDYRRRAIGEAFRSRSTRRATKPKCNCKNHCKAARFLQRQHLKISKEERKNVIW